MKGKKKDTGGMGGILKNSKSAAPQRLGKAPKCDNKNPGKRTYHSGKRSPRRKHNKTSRKRILLLQGKHVTQEEGHKEPPRKRSLGGAAEKGGETSVRIKGKPRSLTSPENRRGGKGKRQRKGGRTSSVKTLKTGRGIAKVTPRRRSNKTDHTAG